MDRSIALCTSKYSIRSVDIFKSCEVLANRKSIFDNDCNILKWSVKILLTVSLTVVCTIIDFLRLLYLPIDQKMVFSLLGWLLDICIIICIIICMIIIVFINLLKFCYCLCRLLIEIIILTCQQIVDAFTFSIESNGDLVSFQVTIEVPTALQWLFKLFVICTVIIVLWIGLKKLLTNISNMKRSFIDFYSDHRYNLIRTIINIKRSFIQLCENLANGLSVIFQLVIAMIDLIAYFVNHLNAPNTAENSTHKNESTSNGSRSNRSISGGYCCVVCQDNEKSVVLLPCRHLCLCPNCLRTMTIYRTRDCPICRKVFKSTMEVYN